jgi:hypothetical protein
MEPQLCDFQCEAVFPLPGLMTTTKLYPFIPFYAPFIPFMPFYTFLYPFIPFYTSTKKRIYLAHSAFQPHPPPVFYPNAGQIPEIIPFAYFSDGEKALKKRTINPQDISLERIWLLNEGHCMRNQIINLCSEQVQKVQAERPYRYESSNVETLRRMVEKNGGMTVLPELSTLEFTEDQIENIRYFEDPEPVREISLVTNGHFVRMSILQALMDEILKLVPEKMRVQKKNRKVLRIQSAKLHL